MSDEKDLGPVGRQRALWVIGVLSVILVAGLFIRRREPPPSVPPPIPSRTPVLGGRATVAIYDDGAPMVDRIVAFHAVDGSVTATLKSGSDGKATSEIEPGGMITVAYGSSIQQLVTIAGVQPNDVVVVGEDENDEESSGDTATIAKITLPGAHPSASRYGVSLGVGTNDIGDAGGPIRLPVMRRFLDKGGKFPALGLAFEPDGGSVAYTFASTSARDAGDTDVRLPAWSTDWREQRIILAGVPAGTTTAKGELSVLIDEERFEHIAPATPITGTEAVLRFAVPRPLGETATYRVELAHGTTDKAILVRRAAAMPGEVRIDLAETLLPRISAPSVERRPDAARPVLHWAAHGNTSKADAAILQVTWPETKEHIWTIVAPPGTRPGFELPALPSELATWRPDARPMRPAVALVEASEYASYDDVKKHWIHLIGESPERDATIRISVAGNIDF